MSFLFPNPQRLPPPPPPPALPTLDTASVEARRRELAEGAARKRRAGLATIQTSGLGDVNEPLIERKSALG